MGQALGRQRQLISFYDAYRFDDDAGRTVTVANGRAILGMQRRPLEGPPKDVAVCAVQLPSIVPFFCLQSRRFPWPSHVRATPTGIPAVDERYEVALLPHVGVSWLSTEIQQLLLDHEWAFPALGTVLVSVTKGAFLSAEDVVQRVHDVLTFVSAFPWSVMPEHVDRSVDDLAARIARISSVDEALAFLTNLTDGDRERLARSDSPLAAFADVRTPEEAMARLV